MVMNHQFTRTDTMELKNQIFKKIGKQRAGQYFDQLKKFFTSQLCKVEFDKVCVRTIGKENVTLHNRLIRSIVKNACCASTPPPKIRRVDGSLSVKVVNGYQRSCLQSLYGDALPQSPRKNRTPVHRNRKCTDRPSPLGPLGKSPSSVTGKSPSVITEDGALRVQEQQSATELLSVGSRPPVQIVSVEEGEEVEQFFDSQSFQSEGPITAPFGVSFNTGGTRKALRNGYRGVNCGSLRICQSSGFLPDTVALRNCLEKRLEGFGVSLDASNLLNYGLDVYMKRVIGSCIGIAGSHSGGENASHSANQFVSRLNGVKPSLYPFNPQRPTSASMLDFRVAMETNPCILGEDWPMQLEKICFRASEL